MINYTVIEDSKKNYDYSNILGLVFVQILTARVATIEQPVLFDRVPVLLIS